MQKDMDPIVEKYIDEHTDPVSPLLMELEKVTQQKTGRAWWSIGKSEGKLLQFLIKIAGVKNAVEIGTFTGYSALLIAEALPPDGTLTTCETNEKYAAIALEFFERSPHAEKIRLKIKPAIETLRNISGNSVDFVFIDADKPSYRQYYEQSVRILKPGGFILVDNVFWRNKIFRKKITNENAKAITAFNEKVRCDDRVEKVMLEIRDGIYLIRKK